MSPSPSSGRRACTGWILSAVLHSVVLVVALVSRVPVLPVDDGLPPLRLALLQAQPPMVASGRHGDAPPLPAADPVPLDLEEDVASTDTETEAEAAMTGREDVSGDRELGGLLLDCYLGAGGGAAGKAGDRRGGGRQRSGGGGGGGTRMICIYQTTVQRRPPQLVIDLALIPSTIRGGRATYVAGPADGGQGRGDDHWFSAYRLGPAGPIVDPPFDTVIASFGWRIGHPRLQVAVTMPRPLPPPPAIPRIDMAAAREHASLERPWSTRSWGMLDKCLAWLRPAGGEAAWTVEVMATGMPVDVVRHLIGRVAGVASEAPDGTGAPWDCPKTRARLDVWMERLEVPGAARRGTLAGDPATTAVHLP